MSAKIYIEGGGNSKELKSRCREGFHKLLKSCGFQGRMPQGVACGSRNSVFNSFSTALKQAVSQGFVAMLVDSEDPVEDIEKTWEHLAKRDKCDRPDGATDEQVLFMATCMETWIVTDRPALRGHFGSNLQENGLPPLTDMENRTRQDIQSALVRSTERCKNKYLKDKHSYELVGKLNPDELTAYLPSFVRMQRILNEKL